MALPATDAFTGADLTALTTYSANWTYNNGTFQLYSNALAMPYSAATDCLAHWNADTFDDDQYAQATIAKGNEYDSWAGPAVRVHASANTGYYVRWNNSNTLKMYKVVAGAQTQLGSTYTGALTVGETIRIEANGSAIRVLQNGVERITATDSAIASGYAGVYGRNDINDASRSARLDDWQGGNLAAGGLSILVAMAAYKQQ